MDTRERIAEWAWLPLSAVLIVVFAQVGVPILRALDVEPSVLALTALIVVLITCCGTEARRDPAAFVSIAVPTVGLGVLALLMPRPFDFAFDLLALAIPLLLAFASDVTWPVWWSAVLRRPALPPWWAFDNKLIHHSTVFRQQAERALADPRQRDRILRNLQYRTNRLRSLSAPRDEWATLRDDLADWEERWITRTARGDAAADDAPPTAADLTARHAVLRSGR